MDQSKLTRMSRYSNKENIIFYVSDMEELPATGHFRKMDAGREIAMHISRGLNNTKLRKYTQYDGGILEANSVGIVFPTHMWGISLAVYSFVKHLRVSTGTYVYAVVVGESMSASVDATLTRRLGSMERFNRIFMEQGFGNEENIYVQNFVYRNTVDRFSDVMWAMEQILFMSLDKRLAIFLLDESAKTGSDSVKMTQEQIARYIGSAREVVSRMLKSFQADGLVELSRGAIRLTDKARLKKLVS